MARLSSKLSPIRSNNSGRLYSTSTIVKLCRPQPKGPYRLSINARPLSSATYPSPFRRFAARRLKHSVRTEEHTSELQSQFHLVCRLLLEKKKPSAFNSPLRKNKPERQKLQSLPDRK